MGCISRKETETTLAEEVFLKEIEMITLDKSDPKLIEHLMIDGLSEHDIINMSEIIRNNYGDWYHARLLRALDILMPHADQHNLLRLETAYPGSTAAYKLWYNHELPLKEESK